MFGHSIKITIVLAVALILINGGAGSFVEPPGGSTNAAEITSIELGSVPSMITDDDSVPFSGRSIRWSRSDTTVAPVDDGGVVSGLANGHNAALAKVDCVSGAADIMVAQPRRWDPDHHKRL